MEITKESAISNCRKMWNWIAEETIKRKMIVEKIDYFEENNLKVPIIDLCYLCEYAIYKKIDYNWDIRSKCSFCPLKFTEVFYEPYCKHEDSPYKKWRSVCYDVSDKNFDNYIVAAKYAKEIAELPEK